MPSSDAYDLGGCGTCDGTRTKLGVAELEVAEPGVGQLEVAELGIAEPGAVAVGVVEPGVAL